MGSYQQQYTGNQIVIVGQQKQLIHAVEFVNVNTGKITFLRFTDGWIANDISHGSINSIFLIIVQSLVGTQKCLGFPNLNFNHETAQAQKA